MSFSKAVCVLCECPTADGAVLAVHVDKDKLQQWALNVCGHEIAHEIDDQDKICFFCLWQAEFLAEHEFTDESLVWWQENLELDDAALLLRRKYFEGEVEQCWVQLEKIEMQNEENDGAAENSKNASTLNKRSKCFYCRKHFKYNTSLWKHMRIKHKNAIRCENRNCATYFHTLVERKKHIDEVHRTQKMFKCEFCAKQFKHSNHYREHVRLLHKEFKFACSFRGCFSYFKSEMDMQTHFDSVHKHDIEMKQIQCNDCGYKTRLKCYLKDHIVKKHWSRTIKCEICNKRFARKLDLRSHARDFHTVKRCKFCNLDFPSRSFRGFHSKLQKCKHCGDKFACSELLKLHVRKQHTKSNWKHCAHCSKSFPNFVRPKHHLSVKHNLIEGILKCLKCDKRFTSLTYRNQHMSMAHSK